MAKIYREDFDTYYSDAIASFNQWNRDLSDGTITQAQYASYLPILNSWAGFGDILQQTAYGTIRPGGAPVPDIFNYGQYAGQLTPGIVATLPKDAIISASTGAVNDAEAAYHANPTPESYATWQGAVAVSTSALRGLISDAPGIVNSFIRTGGSVAAVQAPVKPGPTSSKKKILVGVAVGLGLLWKFFL